MIQLSYASLLRFYLLTGLLREGHRAMQELIAVRRHTSGGESTAAEPPVASRSTDQST